MSSTGHDASGILAENVVDDVVRVARSLVAQGKRPTGSRIRAELGAGTPARLRAAWERHVRAGGEGDVPAYLEMEASLHAYAHPSHEDVVEAGMFLVRSGQTVTGHTLRVRLGGRGTSVKLEASWARHVVLLPRQAIDTQFERLHEILLDMPQDVLELSKFRTVLMEAHRELSLAEICPGIASEFTSEFIGVIHGNIEESR